MNEDPVPVPLVAAPPVLRWIRGASRAGFALAVLLVVALALVALAVLNPGKDEGPIQPATPAVGEGLPPASVPG